MGGLVGAVTLLVGFRPGRRRREFAGTFAAGVVALLRYSCEILEPHTHWEVPCVTGPTAASSPFG